MILSLNKINLQVDRLFTSTSSNPDPKTLKRFKSQYAIEAKALRLQPMLVPSTVPGSDTPKFSPSSLQLFGFFKCLPCIFCDLYRELNLDVCFNLN